MVSNGFNTDPSIISSVAFVDGAVGVFQRHGEAKRATLISGIQADHIVTLDPNQDGVEQISDYLAQYNGIQSLSIFSHGSEGAIQLGNTMLDSSSLEQYSDELGEWGRSLSTNGDIAFFGCNVGGGATGQAFVNGLHRVTGADIAASDDLTGLGGDWDLEVQVGVIESPTVVSADVQAQFQDTLATTIGESGKVTNLNHQWQTITLDHVYDNPVVVAGPPSYRGPDPTTVRVRNVSANSFEMRLDEWEYRDEWHTTETVGYVVMEAGNHILDDGTVITAGTNEQVNHQWETISLGDSFDSRPIVLAQTTSENEAFAVSERLRVNTNSFEIKLQEEEGADQVHADESIGWIAIQPGSGSVGGGTYASGTLGSTNNGTTTDFSTAFGSTPVILANMNTQNGIDTAAVRLTQQNSQRLGLFIEEEKSANDEVNHINERVGFWALDEGLITVESDSGSGLGDDRTVAHWSFDQPAVNGQIDDISTLGQNNPGFLRNGARLDSIGGTLDGITTFDGEDDYIAVRDTRDINLTTHAKRTVTAWFKVDNKTIFVPNEEGDRKQVIYEEGGYGRGLNIYIENGRLYVGGWNNDVSNWSGTYLSTDQIESNTWHHVALVLDTEPGSNTLQPGALSAYIDGVKFGEGEGSQLLNHVGDIGLGAINVDTQFHDGDVRGTAIEAFAGALADVKVYNQALSATEISAQVEAIADEIDDLNFQPSLATETIVAGLTSPSAIDWIPNSQTMLITEQTGVIKVLQNGTLLNTPFIDISDQVNNDGPATRGVSDIAIHPDFEQNPYIYILYAYDPPEVFDNIGDPFAGPDESGVRGGRMIRVTADARTNYTTAVPNSEVVLLGKNSTWDNYDGFVNPFPANSPIRNNPSGVLPDGSNIQDFFAIESNFHNTGSVEFGPDGALYVSLGDSTTAQLDTGAYRSQDLDNLSGKVLRLDPITGDGLSDNPFFDGDADSNRSKVYQYGLRNPFRITIHPDTGEIVIGETGWRTWEEVNIGGAGANFGWPYLEGNEPTEQFENLPQSQNFFANPTLLVTPVIPIAHGAPAIATVMGDFYFGDRYPEQYQGDLFFIDSAQGVVRNVSFDAAGDVAAVDTFTSDRRLISVSQIVEGPDAYLYFVDVNNGDIGRWTLES